MCFKGVQLTVQDFVAIGHRPGPLFDLQGFDLEFWPLRIEIQTLPDGSDILHSGAATYAQTFPNAVRRMV
jgi:hypothetical protein